MSSAAEHRSLSRCFVIALLACGVLLPFTLQAVERTCTAFEDAQAIAALSHGWSVLRCEGNSMDPAVQSGDLAIIDRTTFASVQPGMMAVFVNPDGALVLHRVEQVVGKQFRTRGLKNRLHDPFLLTAENFRGVVVAVLRNHGRPDARVSRLSVAICREL